MPKISIINKLSERFAVVHWETPKGERTANICDVCDGKTSAPAAVRKFAKAWVNA